MSIRHVWIQNEKKELGWKTEGLSTQRREPPFLLNEGILHRQMDKCSITLAKNMHVKILNSICRTCFDFISIGINCLSMNRAYMINTEQGCTLFQCQIMEGFFNIDYTLGSCHITQFCKIMLIVLIRFPKTLC